MINITIEKNRRKKSNQGFTLIELMITVAIVGILASVALPSYIEQVRKARRTDGMDALLNCSAQQIRFYSSNSPPTYLTALTAQNAGLGTCGWDGTNFFSSDAHYSLLITNPNCAGDNSIWCFTVTATATGSQANDTLCNSIAIDHRGIKSSLASDGTTDTTDTCWKD